MARAEPVISLMIVDNQTIIVDALSVVLEGTGGFRVSTAGTLEELHEKFQIERPDVVLIDYGLKEIEDMASLGLIVQQCAPARVAIFSYELEKGAMMNALKMGVSGYIPKTLGVKSLTACVKLIASGEFYVPLNYLSASNVEADDSTPGEKILSDADVDMIAMIEQGKTNKEIGHQFGISESRVKMLLRTIYGKLQANNRAHVVAIARSRNILRSAGQQGRP